MKTLVIDVAVGVPTTGLLPRRFVSSLVALCLYSLRPNPVVQVRGLQIHFSEGSILPQLRNDIALKALSAGASHLLFIDSDQSFPENTLHRLAQWKKPVVACNIATKRFPSTPTAVGEGGKSIYTYPGQSGLRRVWRVGTGIMLIDTEVLRKVPQPWFSTVYLEPEGKYLGEDWFFCQRLEQHGIPVFVDQGLSWEVGHIGFCNYDHSMVIGGLDDPSAYSDLPLPPSSDVAGEGQARGDGALPLRAEVHTDDR